MKWARLVDDPDRATQKQTPEQRMSVRYICEKDLKENFGVWTQYRFPPNCRVSATGKREYEMMIGGFLMYYDDIIRNAVIDHWVCCRWEPKDRNAKDDGKTPQVYDGVTIFVSPKPLRKPADRYPSIHTASQGPSLHDPVRGLHDTAATPAPDYGDYVDPPPPPPPPPPSLDDFTDV